MRRITTSFLLSAAMAVTSANAADNANYTPGDLVLYFQQEGGTNTIYANLGNAATLYRGAAAGPGAADRVNFLNISAALTSAFGSGWATDTTIYAGLAGVWGINTTNTTALQNGDPNRTLYVSAPRTAVGTVGQAGSAGYALNTNAGTSSGASHITAQNLPFDTNYETAVAVSPASVSNIDDENPFSAPGTQGTAFSTFGGGVQQQGTAGTFGTFGAAGSVKFALDLYRILAITNAPGQVAGELRSGSYEGTVTINSSGRVSFISQGVAGSAFGTWAKTFPALDSPEKQLPSADPDNDGLTNLMEFVLNGNPSVADASVAPTLNASGTDFVFAFNRRDDSEAGNTLSFEYSSDMLSWTPATIGSTGAVVGSATIAVSENATSPDAITVTVPKTVAPNGKLFGRLKVTQP